MAYDLPISNGVDPAATTDTTLFTATANAFVWVTATNRTAAQILIRIIIDKAGGGVGDTEFDLYDFPLDAYDSLRRGHFSLVSTDLIVVRASAVDVTFRYDGVQWT